MNKLQALVNRQDEELRAAVSNPVTQSIIRQLIMKCLFANLSSYELRLLIKFLIESVEVSEQITKDVFL